jgi:hypothetical protein
MGARHRLNAAQARRSPPMAGLPPTSGIGLLVSFGALPTTDLPAGNGRLLCRRPGVGKEGRS